MKINKTALVLALALMLLLLAVTSAWAQAPTVPTIEPTPPVIPEASTVVLLGSGATGLAAYVGLQIRARRGSKR